MNVCLASAAYSANTICQRAVRGCWVGASVTSVAAALLVSISVTRMSAAQSTDPMYWYSFPGHNSVPLKLAAALTICILSSGGSQHKVKGWVVSSKLGSECQLAAGTGPKHEQTSKLHH